MNTPKEEIVDAPIETSSQRALQSRTISEEFIDATTIRALGQFHEDLSSLDAESFLNRCRYINKFLEACNRAMSDGGSLQVRFENKDQRKKRLLSRYPLGLNWLIYFVDFLVHRAAPKFAFSKSLYFRLTHGKMRVLSKPEVLGRLVCCGFEIDSYSSDDSYDLVSVTKKREPKYDPNPTYGPLISLKRLGKGGKIIFVYKVRTMHPFSEYLQDYIMKHHGLAEGGKFHEDFRITRWGAFLRKTWLDELPMLINWFKGELKLVGVRPISAHYFSLYPEELQEMRRQVKPGLLPPFYADMPSTLEEIVESEKNYLESYERSPIKTDIQYAYRVLVNILLKRKRSN